MPECPVCQINTDLLTSTQKKQHKRDCEYKTMAVTLADGNILIVKRDSGTGQFVCVYCGNRRKDSNKMRTHMTKECKRRPDASITAVDDLEDEDAETVATEDEDESEETEVVIQTIDDGLDEESEVIASPSTVKRRYEETESDRKHYHKKLRSESPEPTTPDYKQNFLKAVNQAAMEVASATKWKQPVGSLLSAIELTFDAWMAGDLQSLTPRHVATSPFHALAQPAFASPTMLPFVKTPTPSIPSFATTATVTPPSPTLLRRVPMGWMSSSATTLTAPKTPTASTSTSPLPLMGSTPTLVTTPTPPIAFPPIPEMAALEPMASLVTSPNPPMPPMPSTATPPTVPSSLPLDPLHRCLELLVRRCAVCWAHGKRGTDLNHSPWARHCPSSTAATLKIRSFTPLLHKNMSSKVCFGCGISTSLPHAQCNNGLFHGPIWGRDCPFEPTAKSLYYAVLIEPMLNALACRLIPGQTGSLTQNAVVEWARTTHPTFGGPTLQLLEAVMSIRGMPVVN